MNTVPEAVDQLIEGHLLGSRRTQDLYGVLRHLAHTCASLERERDELQMDRARLNWLVERGYAPARWRPANYEECRAGRAASNGMILTGPANRSTIDRAMNSTESK